MKCYVNRLSALIVLTILLAASFVIMITHPPNPLNDETNTDETYFAPDPRLIRPTRAGMSWTMFNRNDVDVGGTTPPAPAPGGGSRSGGGPRPGGDSNELRLLDKTAPGPVGGKVRHNPASSKIHNPKNSQWVKPVL